MFKPYAADPRSIERTTRLADIRDRANRVSAVAAPRVSLDRIVEGLGGIKL